jgi:ubiquitin carboxyl-terminal hydrolase 12/46
MQQDAHEFFNFILNAIHEALVEDRKKETVLNPAQNGTLKNSTITIPHRNSTLSPVNEPTTAKFFVNFHEFLTLYFRTEPTWIQEIFQGTLVNETRCLNCENMSSKDEDFLDLSVDIENVSLLGMKNKKIVKLLYMLIRTFRYPIAFVTSPTWKH